MDQFGNFNNELQHAFEEIKDIKEETAAIYAEV